MEFPSWFFVFLFLSLKEKTLPQFHGCIFVPPKQPSGTLFLVQGLHATYQYYIGHWLFEVKNIANIVAVCVSDSCLEFLRGSSPVTYSYIFLGIY